MKKFFFISNGAKLCGTVENEDGRVLALFVHGWTSSKESKTVKLIGTALKRKDCAVFAFDFFGHGKSEGKLKDMTISIGVKNVIDAAKHARKLGYKRIVLVGSSFGGLCSVLASEKVKPSAVILKAPALDYAKIKFENKGEGFIKEVSKHDAYKAAGKIKCPVLIVHGDADTDVPLSQSLKFSKMSKNCELTVLKGATHDFTEDQLKMMADKSVEFLEEKL